MALRAIDFYPVMRACLTAERRLGLIVILSRRRRISKRYAN
ncbi:hypothetical protein [Helicobacter marmotae]|nr:hypothetical protein [Helicobacter marmotae]